MQQGIPRFLGCCGLHRHRDRLGHRVVVEVHDRLACTVLDQDEIPDGEAVDEPPPRVAHDGG